MIEPSELHTIAHRARTAARATHDARLKDRLYTLARAADQIRALLSQDEQEMGHRHASETDVFLLLQANE